MSVKGGCNDPDRAAGATTARLPRSLKRQGRNQQTDNPEEPRCEGPTASRHPLMGPTAVKPQCLARLQQTGGEGLGLAEAQDRGPRRGQ